MEKRKSKIWTCFTLSEDKERAECHACKGGVSFRGQSIGNLHRHLRLKHPEIVIETRPKKEVSEQRSGMWEFFTQTTKFRAMCNFCDREISYSSGSTSNLGRHIRARHSEELEKSRAENEKWNPPLALEYEVPKSPRTDETSTAINNIDMSDSSAVNNIDGNTPVIFNTAEVGTAQKPRRYISKPKKKRIVDVAVYDLIIIGAGLFGSSAARHASANPTLKVCLIDPQHTTEEKFTGQEIFYSNYDEGTIIYTAGSNEIRKELCKESIGRFRELEKLSGFKFYYPSGSLLVFDGMVDENMIQKVNSLGNFQCVDLSSDDNLTKRFPFMKIKNDAQMFLDDMGAGYINARKMIWAQNKVSQIQGCRIICDEVSVMEQLDGVVKIITQNHRAMRAKRVLLCPSSLSSLKNLNILKKLRLTVRKKCSVLLKIPEQEAFRLHSMPSMITHSKNEHSTVDMTNTYILPPMKYLDGCNYLRIDQLHEIINAEITDLVPCNEWQKITENYDFHSEMLDIFPGLHIEEIQERNTISCHSPTGLPYIDRVTPTITIAAMENCKDAVLCEEIGRIASELSITGKWDCRLPKHLFETKFAPE